MPYPCCCTKDLECCDGIDLPTMVNVAISADGDCDPCFTGDYVFTNPFPGVIEFFWRSSTFAACDGGGFLDFLEITCVDDSGTFRPRLSLGDGDLCGCGGSPAYVFGTVLSCSPLHIIFTLDLCETINPACCTGTLVVEVTE